MKTRAVYWIMTEAVIILGIDPGSTGGIAGLSYTGGLNFIHRFDGENTSVIIKKALVQGGMSIKVAIEAVHAMPAQGVSSTFTFGVGYGRLQGVLDGAEIPYVLIHPQTWQRVLPHAATAKAGVEEFCKGNWGLEPFMFPRCRRPHQGCMDAAVLADYYRQVLLGERKLPESRGKVVKRQPLKL